MTGRLTLICVAGIMAACAQISAGQQYSYKDLPIAYQCDEQVDKCHARLCKIYYPKNRTTGSAVHCNSINLRNYLKARDDTGCIYYGPYTTPSPKERRRGSFLSHRYTEKVTAKLCDTPSKFVGYDTQNACKPRWYTRAGYLKKSSIYTRLDVCQKRIKEIKEARRTGSCPKNEMHSCDANYEFKCGNKEMRKKIDCTEVFCNDETKYKANCVCEPYMGRNENGECVEC